MTVEEEDAFEREHGVPVNAGGSVIVAAWGMGLPSCSWGSPSPACC